MCVLKNAITLSSLSRQSLYYDISQHQVKSRHFVHSRSISSIFCHQECHHDAACAPLLVCKRTRPHLQKLWSFETMKVLGIVRKLGKRIWGYCFVKFRLDIAPWLMFLYTPAEVWILQQKSHWTLWRELDSWCREMQPVTSQNMWECSHAWKSYFWIVHLKAKS